MRSPEHIPNSNGLNTLPEQLDALTKRKLKAEAPLCPREPMVLENELWRAMFPLRSDLLLGANMSVLLVILP